MGRRNFFGGSQFSTGIYIDGHEHVDVVQHRMEYLTTLASYQDRMLTQLPHTISNALPPIIRVFESTFHANVVQSFYWSDGFKQALKQKSLGQAVMVSNFTDEVKGYLKYGNDEACLYLDHQTEGYFMNELFVEQVEDIFERKSPGVIGMFNFDNTPSRCKIRNQRTASIPRR